MIEMSNTRIYVQQENGIDLTRWLTFSRRGDGTCILHLTDLCLPGRVSKLTSVIVPINYLHTSLRGSAVQLTLSTGYFGLRRVDGMLVVEFRSKDDSHGVKVEVSAAEFDQRLRCLEDSDMLVLLK